MSVKLACALALVLAPGSAFLVAATSQQKAWDILSAGAADKSIERRSEAITALVLLPHDGRAIETAERALADPRAEVRVAAATALGDMLSTAAIPKLTEALSDKDPSVMLAAAHSLLALKDKSGYDVYYSVLTGQRKAGAGLLADERKMLHDPKQLEEFGVETGLGFVPYAGMGWSAIKMLTKNDSSTVRAAAALVLAKDPDPRSTSALVDALSDGEAVVRVAAIAGLASRNDPAELGDIEPLMDHEKDPVRYTAAAAVARLSEVRKAPQHREKKHQ